MGETKSSWLFSELALIKILRETKPARLAEIRKAAQVNFAMEEVAKALEIRYAVDLAGMPKVDDKAVLDWYNSRSEAEHRLDTLYKIVAKRNRLLD